MQIYSKQERPELFDHEKHKECHLTECVVVLEGIENRVFFYPEGDLCTTDPT